MKLLLDRKWKKSEYTIGRLYINGELFCNTLEDTDRGLNEDMTLSEIKKIKIQDRTAIPAGIYDVTLDIVSPKFSQKDFYKKICNGKVPRLLDVPGFSGILIHCGTNHTHSSGCILVGYNKIKGGLTDSKETFTKLYDILKTAKENNEEITIEII